MSEVTLIFPHQLFAKHPSLKKERPVILVEEWLFFQQYQFHKQKLIFHRASMKEYAAQLEEKKYKLEYIVSQDKRSDIRRLIAALGKEKISGIFYADPVDDWLEQRIRKSAEKAGIAVNQTESPLFLNEKAAGDYFDNRKTYFQTDFYIDQRKRRNILLEKDSKPVGGKWSFDQENRKKYPSNKQPPKLSLPSNNIQVKEAINYVSKNFPKAYGEERPFQSAKGFFPVNRKEAKAWLAEFLEQRFHEFGPYEDAMVPRSAVLNHSVLSPLLNVGLLTAEETIEAVLEHASSHEIPLNSLEGFIRQILGWREFIRIVYEREGRKQRSRNYWGFSRKIPKSFWEGSTGIPPIDHCIQQVLANCWCHHIERLMLMGNFMLLCEFDPDEVYRWFMELFIDAYDWVMVPNVYGMTQFADGGLMTTKPYISGSNYLMKMGHWEKGEWQATWDGLFWRFMHKQRKFFESQPRLGMLLGTWDKMDEKKRAAHLKNAEDFLKELDK